MAELIWQPDSASMSKFLAGSRGPAFTAVGKMRTAVAARATSKVPVGKGGASGLKGSQVKTPIVLTGDKVVAGVEYTASYAIFVHEGTKPHEIRPVKKKALAWIPRGGNRAIIVKSVNHPGTKAQPWLRDALREAADKQGFIATDE